MACGFAVGEAAAIALAVDVDFGEALETGEVLGLVVGLVVGSPPSANGEALALAVLAGVEVALLVPTGVDEDLGVAVAVPRLNSRTHKFGVGVGERVAIGVAIAIGVATGSGWLVS